MSILLPFAVTYFGSSVGQYALFFAAVIIGVLAAKAAYFLIKKYGGMVALRTSNKFDDLLIEALGAPIVFAGFIAGLVLGYRFLTPDVEFVKANFLNAIGALLVLNVTWLVLRLIDGLMDRLLIPLSARTKSVLAGQLIPLLRNLMKASIALIVIVIILSSFGVDVLPLLAGLGLGGIAIAFAAQKTLEDLFGGLSIFASKPFVVGNTVKVKGVEGDVIGVGMRYTRIKDGDGRIITIPNAQVAQDVIVNISSEPSKRVQTTLGLTYNTSAKKLEEAMEILKEIVKQNPSCDPRETKAVFKHYGQSSLDMLFIYFIKDKKRFFEVQSEINLEVKKRFEKASIEFAFPTQTVYVEKLPLQK